MAVAKKSITKKKPLKTLTVCISHKEDADGISSAALIKQAFGGKTFGLSRKMECLRRLLP